MPLSISELMNSNKKLRYREKHRASVVLSWCTLLHFSGENLLIANQLRLRNGARQLPNSSEVYSRRILFVCTKYQKVTEGQTDRNPPAIIAVCIASNVDAL